MKREERWEIFSQLYTADSALRLHGVKCDVIDGDLYDDWGGGQNDDRLYANNALAFCLWENEVSTTIYNCGMLTTKNNEKILHIENEKGGADNENV